MAKYQVVRECCGEINVLFESTRKREAERDLYRFVKRLTSKDRETGKYYLYRVNLGYFKGEYFSTDTCTSIDVEYYIRKIA